MYICSALLYLQLLNHISRYLRGNCLAATGVQSLGTGYVDNGTSTAPDAQGNWHRQTGSYTRADGSVAAMDDVWFATNPVMNLESNPVAVSADIAALPLSCRRAIRYKYSSCLRYISLGYSTKLHKNCYASTRRVPPAIPKPAHTADSPGKADGGITSQDAIYSQLKVWRDMNHDGMGQANELQTLVRVGVASNGVVDSFTHADGTAGLSGVAKLAGSLVQSSNSTYCEFTDNPALTTVALALPQMQGSAARYAFNSCLRYISLVHRRKMHKNK